MREVDLIFPVCMMWERAPENSLCSVFFFFHRLYIARISMLMCVEHGMCQRRSNHQPDTHQ